MVRSRAPARVQTCYCPFRLIVNPREGVETLNDHTGDFSAMTFIVCLLFDATRTAVAPLAGFDAAVFPQMHDEISSRPLHDYLNHMFRCALFPQRQTTNQMWSTQP